MDYVTKDSGERREFNTGSVRDVSKGKGRYDLITPFAIARVAGVYERGAEKYADRNWEKGQPLSVYLDSGLRHTYQVLEGRTDEDHAAQAAWNLLAFLHTEEMIKRGLLPEELDDLPHYYTKEQRMKWVKSLFHVPPLSSEKPSPYGQAGLACDPGDCGCKNCNARSS